MSDNPAPLAPARRAAILARLARDGAVRVSDLIDELAVTPVTLRRDLAQLEDEGLLVRVHGGAVRPTAGGMPAPVSLEGGGQLGVLVPSLNYYWPSVVAGIEAEAQRLGFALLQRSASYELQDERPLLERLVREEGVRGLVVAPNTDTEHAQDVIDWLAGSGVPAVLAERDAVLLPAGTPVESVTTDHGLGAALAARHFASLGHRRVGLVLSRFSPTSRKIEAGWALACASLGLDTGETRSLPDRSSPDFSSAVAATLDAAVDAGVTALLVHSDPEAMAVVDVALSRGIAVPGQLSIIAYDDEIARLFTPALSAVSPPRAAVGAAAAQLLAARIADPGRPVHRVVVSPALNLRESTAPAP
ncbi:MAG TPA: substrate-binding domain-containing protein [Rhodoglobus sp.]|nr:substrate-binding domain-containing protein [Rhodoglobus sp.]